MKLHSWYDNKLKCMLTHHGNSICWWLLVVWTQPLTGLGSPEYLLLYSLMSLALCLPSSVKFSSAEKLANRMVTCKYVTKPHKIWHLLWHKISIKNLHFHWEALCPLEFQFLVQFIYSIQYNSLYNTWNLAGQEQQPGSYILRNTRFTSDDCVLAGDVTLPPPTLPPPYPHVRHL